MFACVHALKQKALFSIYQFAKGFFFFLFALHPPICPFSFTQPIQGHVEAATFATCHRAKGSVYPGLFAGVFLSLNNQNLEEKGETCSPEPKLIQVIVHFCIKDQNRVKPSSWLQMFVESHQPVWMCMLPKHLWGIDLCLGASLQVYFLYLPHIAPAEQSITAPPTHTPFFPNCTSSFHKFHKTTVKGKGKCLPPL